MNTEEWRAAYKARIIAQTGLTDEQAELCALAAEPDLSIDPLDAADDEMSCWSDDDPDE